MKKLVFVIFFCPLIVQAETSPSQTPTTQTPLPTKTILALGDSLTAGYDIDSNNAYPKLLETKLSQQFPKYKTTVMNAGISGSTTSSGPLRLRNHLKNKTPDILLIALGANDGLRGTPIATIRRNLQEIIQLAKDKNIPTLLAGMKMPDNYGKEYQESFSQMFQTLVQENNIIYIPFLLEDVAGKPQLNLLDLIHPNEKGHQVITHNLYPYFEKFYK